MRKKHKGGKVNRFEPQDIVEITTSPMILTCFQNVGCFQFCERIKQVQNHPELTSLFILNLHNKKQSLAGVYFELLADAISNAIGLPNVGENWFKREKLDMSFYEPFIMHFFRVTYDSLMRFKFTRRKVVIQD